MDQIQFKAFVRVLALSLLLPFGNASRDALADDRGDRSRSSRSQHDDRDDDRDSRRGSSRSPGAVTVPAVGTVPAINGGFSGHVTIHRFARQNQRLVAFASVTGTVTDSAGRVLNSGVQTLVVLPVTVSRRSPVASATPPAAQPRMMPAVFTEAMSGRMVLAQAQSCGILQLDVGAITVDLLGFAVALSPISLDISGDSAGPLGALVCEIVALLGTAANIVGLLNQVLGLLTGLVGGVVGGIGI